MLWHIKAVSATAQAWFAWVCVRYGYRAVVGGEANLLAVPAPWHMRLPRERGEGEFDRGEVEQGGSYPA